MNPRNEHGFTIIELVVVIALLGLLAAVAVPRFANLSSDARTSALNGVRGGFTSAIGIAHSQWLVSGGTDLVITMEGGQTIAMNTDGWPTVDAANAGQDEASELYAALMQGPMPGGWAGSETQAAGAGSATFTLAGPGGGSFNYNGTSGSVQ